MKKNVLFACLAIFLSFALFGQQQVPNGDFEDWETHVLGFENPVGWDTPNASLALFGLTPVVPSDDAAYGSFSALLESKLLSTTDGGQFVIPGVVTLGTFVVDYINLTATLEGGVPFSDRPLALKGSYKNFPASGDSTMVVVIFTRYLPAKGKRDTIGIGSMFGSATVDTWTEFSVPINFFNEEAPDTMNINIVSSNMIFPNKDSYMFVDNLTFEYEAGIPDQGQFVETMIFPNPAADHLSITFGNNVEGLLQVFSNDGQQVEKQTINGSQHLLDVSTFVPGTYFFSVTNGNKKISSGKFMISR
jgi:hypothetical protein